MLTKQVMLRNITEREQVMLESITIDYTKPHKMYSQKWGTPWEPNNNIWNYTDTPWRMFLLVRVYTMIININYLSYSS